METSRCNMGTEVQSGKPDVTKLSGLRTLSMPASCHCQKEEKVMKTTKWYSKILTSLLAMTLIISSASFVGAKGSDKGKSEQKEHDQSQKEDKSTDEQGQKEDKSTDKQDEEKGQKEEKSTDQKVKDKEKKSTDKKVDNKSKTEKKVAIKSKTGKTVNKRINSVDSSISSITKSIDTYFGVNEDGTVDKELTEKAANKKYNSYKGKLKAEINKLRAYDKQLANYKKKNKITDAEYDALLAKSKELQQLAADEIQRVKDLAEAASTPKEDDVTSEDTAIIDTTTGDTTTIDTTSGDTTVIQIIDPAL